MVKNTDKITEKTTEEMIKKITEKGIEVPSGCTVGTGREYKERGGSTEGGTEKTSEKVTVYRYRRLINRLLQTLIPRQYGDCTI